MIITTLTHLLVNGLIDSGLVPLVGVVTARGKKQYMNITRQALLRDTLASAKHVLAAPVQEWHNRRDKRVGQNDA